MLNQNSGLPNVSTTSMPVLRKDEIIAYSVDDFNDFGNIALPAVKNKSPRKKGNSKL